MAITYSQLVQFAGNRLGRHDVACPECGPDRQSKVNQKREVLRVWLEEAFASFNCARCGISGYVFGERVGTASSPAERLKPAADTLSDEARAAEQLRKARYLWSRSVPIDGTIVETYLRLGRGISCNLPPLRFLAPRNADQHPAMIAPFALVGEPEPGRFSVREADIQAVHLTLLAANGRSKAGADRQKIMLGPASGTPIVLAPVNDLLGLLIAEGIEDALSGHEATGLGAWAAGSAGHMPKLAPAVPDYVETVTILADPEDAGQRGAYGLAASLRARGKEVIIANLWKAAA